jgi:hypothetical protein
MLGEGDKKPKIEANIHRDNEKFIYISHPLNFQGDNNDKSKHRCINTKRRF